jgi:L-threonylcarbamoyladenylate synthase
MVFDEDIKRSLLTLRNGGTLLYPTDTIWGLGCDSDNASAVEKIKIIKSRKEDQSMILLVDSEEMLKKHVTYVPDKATQLISISGKPLTIIYPEGKHIAEGICNTDGSVGIRISRDKFCCRLIEQLGRPIVSTSANEGGKPSPSNFSEIERYVINKVNYVVKYRQDDMKKYSPSPIIKVEENGKIIFIR